MTEATETDTVLVVDLDGTLCRTDTLHEAILRMAGSDPSRLLALPGWIARGRAEFKAKLADRGVVDPESLVLNEAVLDLVREAKEAGRKTALVSAADHRQVTAVAEAVGIFDEAYGSAEGLNLKGAAKAQFLTEQYGAGGFDYVGDSRADLAVWAAARRAITVGAKAALRQAAEGANPNVVHIDPPRSALAPAVKAMRPHQWSKNGLLFIPALAAHDAPALWHVIPGFIAFSMTASAVYLLNDLVDLPSDRAHPRKRFRPFAAGDLGIFRGLMLAVLLFLGAGLITFATRNPALLGALALYFVATFAYSLWLKRRLIIDVIMLAGLYTLRIVAGGAAAQVELSPWILGFSMFIFLALAAVKRQTELTDQARTGRKSSGRAYTVADLPILQGMALSASTAAVMVLALYISSDDVQDLYFSPEILWLICPVLLYWLLRMIMKTHRGMMTDDPIVYAVTDRISVLAVFVCGLVALAARYINL